jgi:hypothetical protein
MPTFVSFGINSPTMLSQATNEPATSTTSSPNTDIPSIFYSPTIAPSELSDTDTPSTIYTPTIPTVVPTISPVIVTNRPSTTFPPYVMISKNPSTDEPTTIRITNRPNTSPPIVLPSESPTIAPMQQSSECVSESKIYNTITESGSVFPISPWTTTGDGNWTIYDRDNTPTMFETIATKLAWIQSPNLTGSTIIAIANASISTCETFVGGIMSITILANVLPPTDVFNIYIDGIETVQLIE